MPLNAPSHAGRLNHFYDRLLLRTDGRLFCLLFNARAAIKQRDVRFSYDPHSRMYSARSEKYDIAFYHKKQADIAYEGGIRRRALSLGNIYFLPLIDFDEGDVVVDCGANVGDLKLYFLEKDIPVEYVGIEPSPLEYECLSRNVSSSRTYNLGLWNDDGMLNFYVSSQGADSSFIEPPSFDEVRTIPTRRLDELFDRHIKLLKMEAEGAEPEALLGCENILDEIEYISADLGYERGIEQASTLSPVTNFLLSRNFELVDVSHRRIVALFRNKAYR